MPWEDYHLECIVKKTIKAIGLRSASATPSLHYAQ